MLSDQFAVVYNPGKEISVDEAMIPFKGRSSLKQYLALKPIKRGINVWMRAGAVSGCISTFQVYFIKKGKDTKKVLGRKVVKRIMEELQNTYRHVYFDNCFASALRSNRKSFPLELKEPAAKGLKEWGDSKTFQNGPLVLSVLQDSHPVTFIATDSNPTADVMCNERRRMIHPLLSSVQHQLLCIVSTCMGLIVMISFEATTGYA